MPAVVENRQNLGGSKSSQGICQSVTEVLQSWLSGLCGDGGAWTNAALGETMQRAQAKEKGSGAKVTRTSD